MIAAWWQQLPVRDRRTLAVGAIVVALLLGWALLWHPLARQRADLERAVEVQQRELAWVRANAAEVARLHATGVSSGAKREGKSLLALADASARTAGLGQALKRVEPAGANVRASFENAGFDALAGWIEQLARDYGVEVADVSVERADGVGIVNARVTLQDAP